VDLTFATRLPRASRRKCHDQTNRRRQAGAFEQRNET